MPRLAPPPLSITKSSCEQRQRAADCFSGKQAFSQGKLWQRETAGRSAMSRTLTLPYDELDAAYQLTVFSETSDQLNESTAVVPDSWPSLQAGHRHSAPLRTIIRCAVGRLINPEQPSLSVPLNRLTIHTDHVCRCLHSCYRAPTLDNESPVWQSGHCSRRLFRLAYVSQRNSTHENFLLT